jgi:hypothetical protein
LEVSDYASVTHEAIHPIVVLHLSQPDISPPREPNIHTQSKSAESSHILYQTISLKFHPLNFLVGHPSPTADQHAQKLGS